MGQLGPYTWCNPPKPGLQSRALCGAVCFINSLLIGDFIYFEMFLLYFYYITINIALMVFLVTLLLTTITTLYDLDIKEKQPESGHLCGNITEFGVAEGHPKRSDIAIQYTRRRLFCCYILLFNGLKSFQAEINMYFLLYFIFLNHCRNTSHCNTKVT